MRVTSRFIGMPRPRAGLFVLRQYTGFGAEADMAFKDKEIREEIEEEKRLPTTHRRAYPNRRNDVAVEPGGQPVHVPTPGTPDDPLEIG